MTSPAVKIPLVAVMFTAPSELILPTELIVTTFDSLKVTTPLFVVVIDALTTRLAPVSETPVTPSVSIAPFRIVLLKPPPCVKLAAVIAFAVTFEA